MFVVFFGAVVVMAQTQTHHWQRGTLFRAYRRDKVQVYEIDTHDDPVKRCVLVVEEERRKPFQTLHIKVGKPVRYAVEGSVVYLVDEDGSERVALKGPYKLMVRR
jgi:hypothetical protein